MKKVIAVTLKTFCFSIKLDRFTRVCFTNECSCLF